MTSASKLLHNLRIPLRNYSSAKKKTAYHHHIGKKPLVYRTLGQHLDIAVEKFANTEAIVSCHEGKRYTFSALRDEVDRLAAGFLQIGLQAGDPIGIWAPNNMHWYLTFFAAGKLGLTSVGINPAFQRLEVEYCLEKAEIKAIVAPEVYKTQKYYEILSKTCSEIEGCRAGEIKSLDFPHLKAVIIDSKTELPGAFRFDDVLAMGDDQESLKNVEALQSVVSPDAPCNVQFTSGSTGKPKATRLTHFAIVNNGIHVGDRNELKGERICVQVPLFHVYGVSGSITAAMSYGATLVLPAAGFSPTESLRAIEDEQCTMIYGTPTMYVDLIRARKEQNTPPRAVKMALTGGAPVSPQLIKDMKKELGIEQVKSIYGLTEVSGVAFQSRPGDDEDKMFNSVGHVQDHMEAKVIDKEGNVVSFGEPGELCLRGYLIMLEYFRDEEMTKKTIDIDRWLKTGDQFVLTEDGYGQIVGRIKEMIIRGGENIFPKEIEDFLNTHPDIIETHVIGVEDERMGEEICAFIRLHDGVKDVKQEDIKKFCKGKIAHFKIPRYVKVINEFPKTTSGKIQKFKLKELPYK